MNNCDATDSEEEVQRRPASCSNVTLQCCHPIMLSPYNPATLQPSAYSCVTPQLCLKGKQCFSRNTDRAKHQSQVLLGILAPKNDIHPCKWKPTFEDVPQQSCATHLTGLSQTSGELWHSVQDCCRQPEMEHCQFPQKTAATV